MNEAIQEAGAEAGAGAGAEAEAEAAMVMRAKAIFPMTIVEVVDQLLPIGVNIHLHESRTPNNITVNLVIQMEMDTIITLIRINVFTIRIQWVHQVHMTVIIFNAKETDGIRETIITKVCLLIIFCFNLTNIHEQELEMIIPVDTYPRTPLKSFREKTSNQKTPLTL